MNCRSESISGGFQRLTSQYVSSLTSSFDDSTVSGSKTYFYMIKSLVNQQTKSGNYWNQGIGSIQRIVFDQDLFPLASSETASDSASNNVQESSFDDGSHSLTNGSSEKASSILLMLALILLLLIATLF